MAENPGLPNPDISKIIGKIWKGLPLKEQEPWKKHADVSLATPSLIFIVFYLVGRMLIQSYRKRRLGTCRNTQATGISHDGLAAREGTQILSALR